VVDLIFITKAADGSVVTQEVSGLSELESELYGTIAVDLMGLLTAEDIEQLSEQVPIGTSAIVMIFEHTWVSRLTEEIRKGDVMVLGGGMCSLSCWESCMKRVF